LALLLKQFSTLAGECEPWRAAYPWLREIPRSGEIVAYCRGPYCVLAFEAVALLRKRGFKVRCIEDGYPEWKHAGLPVEQAAIGEL
jgi:rhodanese-related sulfurtransferase